MPSEEQPTGSVARIERDHPSSQIRTRLLRRLNTQVTIEKRGDNVSGILKYIDPEMRWIEVEESRGGESRTHFIKVNMVIDLIGVGEV